MKKLLVLKVMGLALILLALMVFSSVAVAGSDKTLKIGNTVPMKAKEGIQIKKWLELLAERLNQDGGLVVKGVKYNVQIISYDDDYSADTGRAAAERLIYQDKVKHIICQWGSAPIVATLMIAEPNKVLQIGNGMTEKTMETQWNYYYRTPSLFWINGQQVEWVEEFKKRGLPMSVVMINPDDVTGRGATKKNEMLFNNIGVKILDQLFYKRGTTDYTPFATKIKSLNPGFVDTGTTIGGAPTLLLAKALYDVGYKGGKFFNNMADTWKEIVDKVGAEAIEGAVGGFKDPREYRTEKWALELCDAYEKKYGVWETDSVNWINGWFALMAAIKKADSLDPDDLTRALDGLKFPGLYVNSKFVSRPDMNNPRTCDAVGQQIWGKMTNGKFRVMPIISIEENYKQSVVSYGLEKAFGLQ
ncbi:MAG TPA: ABC transporter substrate-binding protein [Desulfatiglandales bacterium]|nr:ABC transporter substrate-binding protein [Desulfatiglandales bacterium]